MTTQLKDKVNSVSTTIHPLYNGQVEQVVFVFCMKASLTWYDLYISKSSVYMEVFAIGSISHTLIIMKNLIMTMVNNNAFLLNFTPTTTISFLQFWFFLSF